MAYKYKTSTSSGSYIEFDISPDLCAGGAFTAGDTIVLTCSFHNTLGRVDYMDLILSGGSALSTVARISTSFPKGSNKSFTVTFTAPDLSSFISGSARSKQFILRFSVLGIDGSGGSSMPSFSSTNEITYVKYRLEPNISSFVLERCNSSGAADNEGTYLRFDRLKLTKSAQASVSDFTVFKLSWESSNGGSGSISPTGPFSQALTSSGYSETGSPSGNLFGTRQFLTTTDYNVTLTVGDAYDTYSMTVVVPRAFAIIHFSGAKNGGVAIGMFSSATDEDPKFEVAENHRAIFYGPVSFEGGVTGIATDYTLGEAATGGHWIDGKPIYRLVATTTNKLNASITVPGAVGTVIHLYGAGKRNDGVWFPLPAVHSTSFNRQVVLQFNPSTSVITVGSTGSDWTGSSGPYIVIMEYTKA